MGFFPDPAWKKGDLFEKATLFFTVESIYQLHRQEEPLLIGNIWDLTSARIF
jgi:hypothetical protein